MLHEGARLGRVVYSPTDATETPAPVTAPSTNQGTSRYVYLVARLRNRQITMEEATELFSIQQAMIRRAPPPPPPDESGTGAAAPPPPQSSAPTGLALPSVDDALWMTLLTMGAGAGVLAAVFKRAQEGPRSEGTAANGSRTTG